MLFIILCIWHSNEPWKSALSMEDPNYLPVPPIFSIFWPNKSIHHSNPILFDLLSVHKTSNHQFSLANEENSTLFKNFSSKRILKQLNRKINPHKNKKELLNYCVNENVSQACLILGRIYEFGAFNESENLSLSYFFYNRVLQLNDSMANSPLAFFHRHVFPNIPLSIVQDDFNANCIESILTKSIQFENGFSRPFSFQKVAKDLILISEILVDMYFQQPGLYLSNKNYTRSQDNFLNEEINLNKNDSYSQFQKGVSYLTRPYPSLKEINKARSFLRKAIDGKCTDALPFFLKLEINLPRKIESKNNDEVKKEKINKENSKESNDIKDSSNENENNVNSKENNDNENNDNVNSKDNNDIKNYNNENNDNVNSNNNNDIKNNDNENNDIKNNNNENNDNVNSKDNNDVKNNNNENNDNVNSKDNNDIKNYNNENNDNVNSKDNNDVKNNNNENNDNENSKDNNDFKNNDNGNNNDNNDIKNTNNENNDNENNKEKIINDNDQNEINSDNENNDQENSNNAKINEMSHNQPKEAESNYHTIDDHQSVIIDHKRKHSKEFITEDPHSDSHKPDSSIFENHILFDQNHPLHPSELLSMIEPLIEKGDPESLLLASSHQMRSSVAVAFKPHLSTSIIHAISESEYPPSIHRLAELTYFGLMQIKRSAKDAFILYLKAAACGYNPSILAASKQLVGGDGICENCEMAVSLLRGIIDTGPWAVFYDKYVKLRHSKIAFLRMIEMGLTPPIWIDVDEMINNNNLESYFGDQNIDVDFDEFINDFNLSCQSISEYESFLDKFQPFSNFYTRKIFEINSIPSDFRNNQFLYKIRRARKGDGRSLVWLIMHSNISDSLRWIERLESLPIDSFYISHFLKFYVIIKGVLNYRKLCEFDGLLLKMMISPVFNDFLIFIVTFLLIFFTSMRIRYIIS